MNRPIKFRAWDIEKKEFLKITDFGFSFSGVECGINPNGNDSFLTPADSDKGEYYSGSMLSLYFGKRIELMQFTGLTDKNGKEIYESDLVEFAGIIFTVGYYQNNACFTLFTVSPKTSGKYQASSGVPIRDFNFLNDGNSGYKRDIKKVFPIEVIGNIYQDKHLIK